MSDEKMREEFEEWAENEGMTMMQDGETYYHHVTHHAWNAWKASRAALPIELPESYLKQQEQEQ